MAHRFRNFLAFPFLLSSSLAIAQVPGISFGGGFSGGPNGSKGDLNFNLGRAIQVKTNAPYSGEDKNETVQTLADGTHITRSNSRDVKIWRDSQGRVRIEQSLLRGPDHPTHPTLVEIEDPVAGYVYILDEVNKVAHRVKANVVPEGSRDPMEVRRPAQAQANGTASTVAPAPAAGSSPPVAAGRGEANPRPRPQVSGPDDLGTSVIDGLPVHGSRYTTVIPTGSVGNDAPLTTTSESWYSPDLNLVIRRVTTDPQSGVQTNGIGNLSLSDPDPSLFTVPVDYQLVDEGSSRFTIKWDTTGTQQTGK
jgi:hypothetical protein